jgi:hypothetical protein
VSLVLAAVGCASPAHRPHRALTSVWRDYERLADERALAVAGELRGDRWVAGATGGHVDREAAESTALAECQKRRLEKRMQDPCLVYASGDEIVWPKR